jgi:hypothetical protein
MTQSPYIYLLYPECQSFIITGFFLRVGMLTRQLVHRQKQPDKTNHRQQKACPSFTASSKFYKFVTNVGIQHHYLWFNHNISSGHFITVLPTPLNLSVF